MAKVLTADHIPALKEAVSSSVGVDPKALAEAHFEQGKPKYLSATPKEWLGYGQSQETRTGKIYTLDRVDYYQGQEIPVGTVFKCRVRDSFGMPGEDADDYIKALEITYNGGDTSDTSSYSVNHIPHFNTTRWYYGEFYTDDGSMYVYGNFKNYEESETGDYLYPSLDYVAVTEINPLTVKSYSKNGEELETIADFSVYDYIKLDYKTALGLGPDYSWYQFDIPFTPETVKDMTVIYADYTFYDDLPVVEPGNGTMDKPFAYYDSVVKEIQNRTDFWKENGLAYIVTGLPSSWSDYSDPKLVFISNSAGRTINYQNTLNKGLTCEIYLKKDPTQMYQHNFNIPAFSSVRLHLYDSWVGADQLPSIVVVDCNGYSANLSEDIPNAERIDFTLNPKPAYLAAVPSCTIICHDMKAIPGVTSANYPQLIYVDGSPLVGTITTQQNLAVPAWSVINTTYTTSSSSKVGVSTRGPLVVVPTLNGNSAISTNISDDNIGQNNVYRPSTVYVYKHDYNPAYSLKNLTLKYSGSEQLPVKVQRALFTTRVLQSKIFK